MIEPGPEDDFRRFSSAGDTAALGRVFERLAPELLLVAAHLASGNLAEDLVQATFLDAIRQRDRWDSDRPLAAWLCGILANHVLRARREQRRVPDPQRLPLKECEGPHAAAEARELAEAVHAAVERLPLGYRQVLSLRLVHGLELQQIGNALGMPIGTVKTKLHRGVVLLRRALPAGLAGALAMALLAGRGLAAVREVVISHAGAATGATVGAGALLGVLTMKKAVTFAAGTVVLALGAWGVASVWPRAEAGSPEPQQPVELRAQGEVAAAPVQPAPAEPATREAPAAPVQREPLATNGALQVDVVWSDGTAAVGLEVRTYLRRDQSPMKSQPMLTDASGRATFADLQPGEYGVMTPGPHPVGRRVVIEAGAIARQRLVIEGDLVLEVQVVDASDRGQAGAEVWAQDDLQAISLLGRTDGAGRLVHRCLSMNRIWASRTGNQPSLPTPWSLLHDEQGQPKSGRVQVRLQLGPAGCRLQGQVVDPQQRPVPSAQVVIAQDESLSKQPFEQEQRPVAVKVIADAQGRFACDEVGEGEHPVQAVAEGFAPATARAQLKQEEPAVLTLQLAAGAAVTGRVSQRDGTPIAGARIEGSPERHAFGFDQYHFELNVRRTVSDAEGRFRLAALRPGELRLSAKAADLPVARRHLELRDGETTTWDLRLPEGSDIIGRVVDQDGKALGNWTVTAFSSGVGIGQSNDRRTVTAADGRFEFLGMPDLKCSIRTFAPDTKGAAAMVWRASADVQPPASDVELRVGLAEGAFITGQVVWPAGASRERVTLSLYPKQRGQGGFGVPQERLPPGTDEFRIGPLPPGEYDLLCDADGRSRIALRALSLTAGQTLQASFRLDQQQPLLLRLRHADGRPVTAAVVRLKSEMSLIDCKETGPGEYRTPPTAAGSYTATVRGRDFAPFTTRVEAGAADATTELTVPPGTAVRFRLRPARAHDRWVAALRMQVTDARGTELVNDLVQVDGTDHFDWQLGLAAGSYTLLATDMAGRRKSATVQVDAPGDKPQVVEVQLEKN